MFLSAFGVERSTTKKADKNGVRLSARISQYELVKSRCRGHFDYLYRRTYRLSGSNIDGIQNTPKSAYHGEITGLNYQHISSIRNLSEH